ncbi:Set domain protein [Lasiodiplodia theobromae]|uniref:Set domain protein n=1 Tax=Lasiodiplodia theobromae TaxID=45133 RepID=UPI0015C34C7B|nr:Set domain protein [Lasiodiplodia theobromae]KAF4545586.1 Set domain protein [Lasiodiplodia theobromae]
MPVHRGSRTKVHLVSTDLRSTTTDEPSNKKAPNVSEHVSNVEQTLKDGHVLKERNIPLAGDDNPLHLLGGDEYMPFLFVRAGEDMRPVVSGHLTPCFTLAFDTGAQPATRDERVFHPDPTRNAIYARILGSDPADAIKIPRALALRVELSKQSFLKTDTPIDDIRIDVLFNGQLTHSGMWPKRFYQEEPRLLSIFSGLRFHWMLERAWLIVPPGQDPDGSRRRPVASSDTLADRWEKIQKEVLEEALARGVDKNGERPMVAKYLMEVAKLAMPPELETWSEPRGQTFGVVDVVLSYGRGFKDHLKRSYLHKPTRMGSSRFKEGEENKSIFESISILPKTNLEDTTGRYNLRAATPERPAVGGRASTISRVPARPRPGKTSARTLKVEQSDTLSGPSVEREGNRIISSEQLPSYLSDEMTKSGYTVQVGSSTNGSLTKTNDEKTTGGNKKPSKEQEQACVSTPSHITNRSSRVIERLDGIPEEDEEEAIPASNPGDVFTSSGTGSQQGPRDAIKTSSVPLGSSQSSDTSKLQIIPLSSSMSDMPSGLPSPRGSLLPPVQIHTSVRSRRLAEQDEGGSPRKKRRLSGPLSPLDIKKTEGGIGMTHRGVFTALGSPSDKSQRSMFNSFTLGSRIDLDPAGPRQRPPTSPLSPDLSFRQREDPLLARLVFKSKGEAIRTLNITHPFRISQLRSVAAAAEARSNKKRLLEGKPPFPKFTSHFSPSIPSTPHQHILASPTQAIPQTPFPIRTRAGNPSSAGSAPGNGGIFDTPNPLPRYPKAPTKSPYSTATPPQSQPLQQTPVTRATTTTTRDTTPESGPSSPGTAGPASASAARRPEDRRNTHAQMERDFRAFVAPELCRDCAITYAQPPLPPAELALPHSASSAAASVGDNGASWREWKEGEPRAFGGSVVRQIKSERAGGFEEEGILVGVRFLVV